MICHNVFNKSREGEETKTKEKLRKGLTRLEKKDKLNKSLEKSKTVKFLGDSTPAL